MEQLVKEVTITRVFNAPHELVFKAWTDPKLVAQWFGPEIFDIPFCELDPRPGGRYMIHMRDPQGVIYPDSGEYLEVVAPERIVFTSWAFDDGQGGHLLETLNTLTLTEAQGRTTMTMQVIVTKRTPEVEGALAGMEIGWSQSFDKLGNRLEGMIVTIDTERLEVTVTRLFDAPRELVFKISTDPALVARWWGPRRYTTEVDHLDLKQGGTWRFLNKGADGSVHAFHGVYREITPPECLVYTFEYEGAPGHPLLETVHFDDYGGKTRVTAVDRFESLDDLYAMAAEGMEEGARESYERADELLAELKNENRRAR